MNINTDISAASNGAYQIRSRQANTNSLETFSLRSDSTIQRAADTVQFTSQVADAAEKVVTDPSVLKTASKLANEPAASILEAILNPEEAEESQANGTTPTYTAEDLESLLSFFGASYDLDDVDGADPQVVQYDFNGDGLIDADDLGTLLNLMQ